MGLIGLCVSFVGISLREGAGQPGEPCAEQQDPGVLQHGSMLHPPDNGSCMNNLPPPPLPSIFSIITHLPSIMTMSSGSLPPASLPSALACPLQSPPPPPSSPVLAWPTHLPSITTMSSGGTLGRR